MREAATDTSAAAKPTGCPARRIRVGLVDDHPAWVETLRDHLEDSGDFTVVGTAGDGRAALRLVETSRPDLLVLDLGLPGLSGAEVARQVRSTFPAVAIVVLTGYDDPGRLHDLLALGVRGFLSKTTPMDEILRRLQTVARGEGVQVVLAPATGTAGQPTADPFTAREREVLVHLATGSTNAEIASALGLAEKTVEGYVTRILAKLEVPSRTGAAARAHALGLLPFQHRA